ncbi:MAG: MBL fold metallo-hydrolase [Ilumatobacter sp.]|nr:MBL fold metallo-hydrolase [Ilumatobacter sp.]
MSTSVETFRVGAIECRRLVYGNGRGAPAWMFPDVPAPLLHDRFGPYVDRGGHFEYVYSSLVVSSGSALLLVDASSPAPGPAEPSGLDQALSALGVAASDVDTVVLTHGHLDHLGGLVRAGRPVFGAARHVIGADEFGFWTAGDGAGGPTASMLDTITRQAQVELAADEREVVPGVRVLPTPGHTPGHLAVELASQGEMAFHVGDVLAHEVNVAEPDWNHFSDMDPARAAASRRRLVARAADARAIVVGSHMATFGRVVRRSSGEVGYRPCRHSSRPDSGIR